MNLLSNSYKVQHLLIIEDQKGRRTIPLEDLKYSLGRKFNNQIPLCSKQASRQHATLVRKSSDTVFQYSYWILDGDLEGNKSNNGIYVNGQKCLVHELKDGDLINFGCDVNASYHLISTVPETITESLPSNQIEKIEKPLTNLHQKTTLILNDTVPNLNSEDTIQEQAYLDVLTELPNRALFNEYLSIAINNAKKNQKIIAILLLDIEQFVNINNKFGYHIGDRILQDFGKRLKNSVRSGDIVARWGGDEFVVLLSQINTPEDTNKIAQRLLNQLKRVFEVDNQAIYLRISLGTVIYPFDGIDAKIILNKANENLTRYKQQIHQSSYLQKPTLHTKTSASSRVEYLLHQALDNEEFILYYQPQININTNKIEGMEALLRWQHPQAGLISPAKFLPLAQKTDLIFPISHWVIQTACNQNKAWQKDIISTPPVSVNLFPQQLQNSNLVKMLVQILTETGLEPYLLELEITENSILKNLDNSYRIFHDLEQIGVKLSLDDFGLGYIAVGCLHQLPIQKLKISQSIIKELQTNPHNIALVTALIGLGRNFNLNVVAEGVETQQQLELLQKLDCEKMQGYYFSQPLPTAQATEFLTIHSTLLRSSN